MPMPLSGLAQTLSQAVQKVQSEIVEVQEQLASGTRTLNPAEDGIVTRLSAQASGYGVVQKNIDSAQAVIDVSQTALSSVASIMNQMKSLATQAQSAGLTDTDLESINTTFTQLASQVSTLATNASVNGANLLGGSGFAVTTGIDGGTTSSTSVSGVALSTTIYTAISTLKLIGDSTTDVAKAATASQTYAAAVSIGSSGSSVTSAKTTSGVLSTTAQADTLTFTAMKNGDTVVIGKGTLTATADLTALEVRNAFFDQQDTAVSTVTGTGYSMTIASAKINNTTDGFVITKPASSDTTALFTYAKTVPAADTTAIATTGSKVARSGIDVVTFTDLYEGDTVTAGGLTFTATSFATAAQAASQWASIAAGTAYTAITATTYGTWSGAMDAGTSTGAYTSGSTITFTKTSANIGAVTGTSSGARNAATAVGILAAQLTSVSTGQSTLTAASTGLSAQKSAANALQIGLQKTVDSIQNIDATAMQARLQQLNNQQSIDYYLVSQMNTEAAAILSIFR
jgi:flagellin-like hook-associated protein FlgL